MKIGIYYGSTTGTTERIATMIADKMSDLGEVAVRDVATDGTDELSAYDLILLGTSTWGDGDLQDDWMEYENLDGCDLTGKTVAVFGTGDQEGYPETFVDGIRTLAESAESAGAKLIGCWPTDGYEFEDSAALRDGKFLGLAIDEDNQDDQTETRIAQWTAQLKAELGA